MSALGTPSIQPAADAAKAWSLEDNCLRHVGEVGVEIAPRDASRIVEPADGDWAARFVLQEWTTYRVKIEGAPAGVRVFADDQCADDLGDGIHLLAFKNAVGLSRIAVCDTARRVLADVLVEVTSPKLSTVRSDPLYHPRFLEQLVACLYRHLAVLPFDIGAPTHTRTGRRDAPTSELFLYHFLKDHREDIADALDAVLAAPFRVLEAIEETVPAGRVTRLHPAGLRWAASHVQTWSELPAGQSARAWWHHGGRSFAPTTMLIRRAEETCDSPENRFVRHFVEAIAGAATHVKDLLPEASQSMDAVARQTSRFLQAEWVQGVGPMSLLPVRSHVMLRRAGYARLWRLYPAFLFSRTPLAPEIAQAVAARNVAKLYEVWCFFELAARIAAEWELTPPRLRFEAETTGALAVRARADLTGTPFWLEYNRPFSGPGAPAAGRSYSVALQPDIVVHRDREVIGVFDAKFRLRLPQQDADDERTTEDGRPVNADVYKMHTYRDALGLRFAVALYPGAEGFFYQRSGVVPGRVPTPAQVIADAFWAGTGALSFRPEERIG